MSADNSCVMCSVVANCSIFRYCLSESGSELAAKLIHAEEHDDVVPEEKCLPSSNRVITSNEITKNIPDILCPSSTAGSPLSSPIKEGKTVEMPGAACFPISSSQPSISNNNPSLHVAETFTTSESCDFVGSYAHIPLISKSVWNCKGILYFWGK